MARNSEHPIILFNYEPHRSKKAALNLLPGFNGTLLCDGYKVYPSLRTDIPIKIAGCMAHVRRKFWLAEKIIKKEAKQTTPILASKALAWIKKLYAIEKEIKHREPEDILRVRQARSLPLMQEFKAWLDGIEQRILPSSPTGKAVSYALGQWDFLLEFTKNPAVVLDNNYVEAHIRPFVVGRNAWMFSATPMGAHASAALYSLVETAKANGIDPHDYLTLIFKELPLSPDLESLEKLLPYEAKKHFPLKQFVASK